MLRIVFIGFGVLFLVFVLLVGGCVLVLGRNRLKAIEITDGPVSTAPGTYRVQLEHDGRERQYLVHVPPGAQGIAPLALIVALHGGGGAASKTDDLMKLTAVADREGFFVVFPDGVGNNWNDGRTHTGSVAERENIDDVGFIKAVVEDVRKTLYVDPRRVYATGISNGAMMSTRLACEAADVFAAVAPVAGTAPEGFEATCNPGHPVSIIVFLGTKDPLVPYGGGVIDSPFPFGRKRGRVVSADALKTFWAANNRCSPEPVVADLTDRVKSDHSTVVAEFYANCAAGSAVDFYRVEGGGHTWPGGKQYLTHYLVGRTNRDISATELIWRFFVAHPKQ